MSIALLLLVPLAVTAQPGGNKVGGFVDQGAVAFNTDYTLAKNRSFILFNIRNKGPRTIRLLFAWVYLYREGPNGPTNFRLVNNPHQPALLAEGGPHRPGKIAQWRFALNFLTPPQADEKFTLRVSPKSVFYARLEPPVFNPQPK